MAPEGTVSRVGGWRVLRSRHVLAFKHETWPYAVTWQGGSLSSSVGHGRMVWLSTSDVYRWRPVYRRIEPRPAPSWLVGTWEGAWGSLEFDGERVRIIDRTCPDPRRPAVPFAGRSTCPPRSWTASYRLWDHDLTLSVPGAEDVSVSVYATSSGDLHVDPTPFFARVRPQLRLSVNFRNGAKLEKEPDSGCVFADVDDTARRVPCFWRGVDDATHLEFWYPVAGGVDLEERLWLTESELLVTGLHPMNGFRRVQP